MRVDTRITTNQNQRLLFVLFCSGRVVCSAVQGSEARLPRQDMGVLLTHPVLQQGSSINRDVSRWIVIGDTDVLDCYLLCIR